MRQALVGCPHDEQAWEDGFAVAKARGGPAAVDRAFQESENACGPQPPGTPLHEADRLLPTDRLTISRTEVRPGP